MLKVFHQESEHKFNMLLQGNPNEGNHRYGCEALQWLGLTQVRLITWDPGEGPARQHIFKTKRPVETNKSNGQASMPPTKQENLASLR